MQRAFASSLCLGARPRGVDIKKAAVRALCVRAAVDLLCATKRLGAGNKKATMLPKRAATRANAGKVITPKIRRRWGGGTPEPTWGSTNELS